MLQEKYNSKSIRVSAAKESGEEVMSSGAQYGERGISISFDMFDPEYCAAHKDEVQQVMTSFLARLNQELTKADLPLITTA